MGPSLKENKYSFRIRSIRCGYIVVSYCWHLNFVSFSWGVQPIWSLCVKIQTFDSFAAVFTSCAGVQRFVYISAADFGVVNYLLRGYYEGKVCSLDKVPCYDCLLCQVDGPNGRV